MIKINQKDNYNWGIYNLNDILEELNIKNKEKKEYPVLSVTQGNGIMLQSEKYKKEIASEDKSRYKIVPENSIVFNPNYLNFGAIGIQEKVVAGLVSSIYGVFQLKRTDLVDFTYLKHLIRSPIMIHEYNKYANGSTKIVHTGELHGMHVRLSVSIKDFKKINWPFPPIEEQQKIAEILSTVDEQIEITDQLLEKMNEFKKGLMQQLLTKGIRHTKFKKTKLGDIPVEWEVKKIDDFAYIGTGKKDTKNKINNGKYPFFVRSQTVEHINTFSYDGEAVLTAGDGVGVGKVFHYINGKFDFHQRVYKISDFKSIEGKYFFYYFKQNFIKQVRKYNAKTSVDSVRMEMISKMLIPIPSLEEQQKITEILTTVDDQIENYEKEKEKYTELKKGLMQHLLTGKIRVTV